MTHLEHGISAQSSTDDIWATGMDSPHRGGWQPYGAIWGLYIWGHMGAIWGPYGGHMRPYGGGYCALMARPSERSRLRYTIGYLPACAHSHPHMAAYGRIWPPYGPHIAPIWPHMAPYGPIWLPATPMWRVHTRSPNVVCRGLG